MICEIRIGRVGKIMEGDEKGCFIKIMADAENTGGYLILTAEDKGFLRGFDNWVESYANLKRYFDESNWTIDWEN